MKSLPERSDRRTYGLTVLVLVVATFHWGCASEAWPQRRRPRGLKPGDTIMLVAPAGPVSRETIIRIQQHLTTLGYRVLTPPDLDRHRGYLAGTDAQRAAELMQAFLDPQVTAIFPVTGGYGTTRILDRLDFEAIQRLTEPKILIGFSDLTGLHLAMAAKTDWVTFHSPNPDGAWGKPSGLNEFSTRWFWRCLKQQPPATDTGFTYVTPDPQLLQVIQAGTGTGPLVGGNLSLIVALMGTPYEIETDGRVVFLEDVHEAPYRVDRYLSQLRLAGKLQSPAAVVLGQFTDSEADSKATLTMEQVFADYFADASYPVLSGFPAGHHRDNATLPLGIEVQVVAQPKQRLVRVNQDPVK